MHAVVYYIFLQYLSHFSMLQMKITSLWLLDLIWYVSWNLNSNNFCMKYESFTCNNTSWSAYNCHIFYPVTCIHLILKHTLVEFVVYLWNMTMLAIEEWEVHISAPNSTAANHGTTWIACTSTVCFIQGSRPDIFQDW